jgi:Protein of unknown function (DUF1549)/Protein of unknown function (DUF1553)
MSPALNFCQTRTWVKGIVLIALWAVAGVVSHSEETPAQSKNEHWAFKPTVRPAVPGVKDRSWPRNPIDQYVLAKLESEKLTPSAAADRVTLIRRLTFDLTGLPPTPEEVGQFVSDKHPDACERIVDRLLNSPRYGERWARHWLDVVHYGESHGYDKDKPRPNAWPYRDYVIRSLNNDTPYSRFVQEQIAGDMLFPDSADGVVATGFIAAGPWDFVGHVELSESKTDGLIARYNDRDDMVMNTMSTFLSLTVHCARCHDHKFDPISQEEYYGLQAVFAGVDRADRPFDLDPRVAAKRRSLMVGRKRLVTRQKELNEIVAEVTSPQIAQIGARLKELKEQLNALPKPDKESPGNGLDNRKSLTEPPAPPDVRTKRNELKAETDKLEADLSNQVQALLDDAIRSELADTRERLIQVNQEIDALPKPQMVYAAADDFAPSGSFLPPGTPRPIHLLKRGDVKRPGPLMSPAALNCVPGLAGELPITDPKDEGSRRAALAKWITDPRNMLTRRSIVNRVWQYHFGRGIVDTPNDFGHMGSPPSHPELLDWLACWFLDSGESLKKLHRLIVTSATYRQCSSVEGLKRSRVEAEDTAVSRISASTVQRFNIDSENRLLWRMNRQRLDAESFHDTLLFLTGRLDLTMGGPSARQFFFKDDHSPVYDYTRFEVDSPDGSRPSIYRFIVRSVPDPFMETLDCPDASLLTPKRNVTLTALQALSTLNNPFVLRQCEHFAARLQRDSADLSEQIDRAYRLALSRPPRSTEAGLLRAYARNHGLANACRLLFNSSEFVFVD